VKLFDGLNLGPVCASAMRTDIASSNVGVEQHKEGMGPAVRAGPSLGYGAVVLGHRVLDSGRSNKTKPICEFAAQTFIFESEKQTAMVVDRKKRPPSVRLNQDGPIRPFNGIRFSNFHLRENCQKCERVKAREDRELESVCSLCRGR
jgi:hypothetical protein